MKLRQIQCFEEVAKLEHVIEVATQQPGGKLGITLFTNNIISV